MSAETITPPTGYAIVKSGNVQSGDLAWDAAFRTWTPSPSILNYPAEDYNAICRIKEACNERIDAAGE